MFHDLNTSLDVDSEKIICCSVNIDILDIGNIEMMMQIAERDQLLPLQLAKISSNHFHLHYDVLVSSDVKDLKIQVNWADFEVYPNCSELEDSIYNEANPNTSGLKKDLIYNEANPNLFVSSSPEPPNIYAAASSFIQSR